MDAWLKKLGLKTSNPGVFDGSWRGSAPVSESISPIDGRVIARIHEATAEAYDAAVGRAQEAFLRWRLTPAPVRGECVRRLGEALRASKADLARLVTLETGKILAESEGEVQEMIDICDFAVGLSRQLHGLTIASERPQHRLMEQWHPLGLVGLITAFNFPVAVWAWNSALAAVCGDACLWKPSNKTSLCAIAVTRIAERVCRASGVDPSIFTLLTGDAPTVGERLAADSRVPLVSATGSCAMGRRVAQVVHGRLGRTWLRAHRHTDGQRDGQTVYREQHDAAQTRRPGPVEQTVHRERSSRRPYGGLFAEWADATDSFPVRAAVDSDS